MVRPDPPADPDVDGLVTLTYNPAADPLAESLTVEILSGGDFTSNVYSVWIQDVNSVFVNVGALAPESGSTEAGSFFVDENEPNYLVFLGQLGITDFSEIQRHAVEIREFGGAVHLDGAVPLLASSSLCSAPDDPQPIGEVTMDRHAGRESLLVRVENVLLNGEVYFLLVEDPIGTDLFTFAGTLESNTSRITPGENVVLYRSRPFRGEGLPLGLNTLDDLEDRKLRVLNDQGDLIVEGFFPPLVPRGPRGRVMAELPLVRDPYVFVDPRGKGKVRIRQDFVSGRQILDVDLRVSFEGIIGDGEAELSIELVAGSGVYNTVGCLFDVVTRSRTRAALKIDTREGEALPLGVRYLDDIAGYGLEVRDPGGGIYMRGRVPTLPPLGARLRPQQALAELTNQQPGAYPDAMGSVQLKGGTRGQARLTVRTTGLRPGSGVYRVQLQNPNSLLYEDIGLVASPGRSTLDVRTQRGDPLPFGLLLATELQGLPLRVVEQGGATILDGVIPSF